jgi:hypothetical protein
MRWTLSASGAHESPNTLAAKIDGSAARTLHPSLEAGRRPAPGRLAREKELNNVRLSRSYSARRNAFFQLTAGLVLDVWVLLDRSSTAWWSLENYDELDVFVLDRLKFTYQRRENRSRQEAALPPREFGDNHQIASHNALINKTFPRKRQLRK